VQRIRGHSIITSCSRGEGGGVPGVTLCDREGGGGRGSVTYASKKKRSLMYATLKQYCQLCKMCHWCETGL